MIRLIQRRLIIPRGDTGSFSIPTIAAASQADVAVFTIFDCLTHSKLYEKIIPVEGETLNIVFTHNDTVNLTPGKYVWDIKFYANPQYADEKLINGDEIDSYYAGFSLPVCEIRETGDNLLVSPDAPTGKIDPAQLDIITAAIEEVTAAVNQTATNVSYYPIIQNNMWYLWDAETQEYVNTNISANGIPGPEGRGIVSINKTGTSGLVDTYTITYSDNSTSTFTVTNGESGSGHGLPSGGTTGQALIKSSNTDYAVEWGTAQGLPSGGTGGDILLYTNEPSWFSLSNVPLEALGHVDSNLNPADLALFQWSSDAGEWTEGYPSVSGMWEKTTYVDDTPDKIKIISNVFDPAEAAQKGFQYWVYNPLVSTEQAIMRMLTATYATDTVTNRQIQLAWFIDVTEETAFPKIHFFKTIYNSEQDEDELIEQSVFTAAINLNDLSNINISSPTNRQVLSYQNSSQKWVNTTMREVPSSGNPLQFLIKNGYGATSYNWQNLIQSIPLYTNSSTNKQYIGCSAQDLESYCKAGLPIYLYISNNSTVNWKIVAYTFGNSSNHEGKIWVLETHSDSDIVKLCCFTQEQINSVWYYVLQDNNTQELHFIPSGGTANQVLAKTNNTNYAVEWATPHYIPSGGSTGQVLTKTNGNNYNVEWKNVELIKKGYLADSNGRTYIRCEFTEDIVQISKDGYGMRIYELADNSTIMYMIAAFSWINASDTDELWAWFIDVSNANIFPKIRMFKKEWDDYYGEDLYFEQTPPAHTVTGAWVGTAQEYAALSPNYDSNTIYYIKE